MDDDDLDTTFAELVETKTEMSMPALNVHVDFIDLLDRMGSEEEAMRVLGVLKDLL